MATTTFLNIAFIGGGNMASALIAGLLAKGQPTSLLHVVETDAETLADFQAQGLNTHNASIIDDTKHAIEKADVVVLAVKPQVIKDVL
ncbi:NAD(P)-binding domain-containing protein, partial [Xanthomonas citri pv. citri]